MSHEPFNEPVEVNTALLFARAELEAAKERNALARVEAKAAEEAERDAHVLVGRLERHLRNVEAEPVVHRELDDLTGRLCRALDAPFAYPGDFRSPTRARVVQELETISDDPRLVPHDKLERIRQLARDFNERRTLDGLIFANSERR